jgi:hypothetical protein
MKRINGSDVGVLIETRRSKPEVILYIDHVTLTRECQDMKEAERAAGELANVLNLWDSADGKAWKVL